ncbi:MAG: hypothetical protein B6U85_00050 [Desulfurococcales archaeon ex4484_42]|nr:MAG: hypothetical protein B6U85_00050 [Desulfurococcales archaeon ex4484_42]
MGWVTVSAKIRKELYEKLKRYGVPISEVIRKALEEEVRRREEKEVREALKRAQEILMKIPPEEIVTAVRSSREER